MLISDINVLIVKGYISRWDHSQYCEQLIKINHKDGDLRTEVKVNVNKCIELLVT